jgi:hypothetical protein
VLIVNRAAHPEDPAEANAKNWSGSAGETLARASEKADRFDATIRLPEELDVTSAAKVWTLGEAERLSDRSVDPNTFNVHEIKVRRKPPLALAAHELRYTLSPHSAVLFEVAVKAKPPAPSTRQVP